MLWIIAGLALYNLIVLIIYALDKWKARRGQWRISEATLLTLALLGGAAGGCLGIYWLRHKSRKPRFYVGVPVMLVAQLLLLGWAGGWLS